MTIEKIVSGGAGLARMPEVVLVPRTAVGERVAIVLDRGRKPARGRLLEVLEPSADRVTPPCLIVDRCGGCDLMHLSPSAQRAARLSMLREALPTSLQDLAIEYLVATPVRGRTRARWHGKALGGGRVLLGYRAASSNTVVDVEACHALDPRLETALVSARSILAGGKGEGDVHAALGEGGAPVISIEWRGELAPTGYRACEDRVREGKLAGVEIVLEGVREPAITGNPRPIGRSADGLALVAPPRGFAQASEVGDQVLVERVALRAEALGKRVVELFAGSGNLTVALAAAAEQITAIEIAEPACQAARENLRARGLAAKVRVVVGDADATPIAPQTDVVVLDPPRAGAPGAVRAIVLRKVKRVVYVSCEPATLGRDLGVLLEGGYVVKHVDAIDLFPDTSHVETIVTLVRER